MGFNSQVNRPRPEAYRPKKNQLAGTKTLAQALKDAHKVARESTPTVWKDPKDCIDEWQRVLDMRAEGHPLILGGNYRA